MMQNDLETSVYSTRNAF